MHAGQLEAFLEDRRLARLEVAGEPVAMRLAQRRWHDEVREQLPGHFPAAVPEGHLGGSVELDDSPLVVHRDHAVEGGLEHGPAERLALPNRLFGASSFDLLADLHAEPGCDGQQVVVHRAPGGGEELDHAQHALGAHDRERERGAEPGVSRRLSAR